MLNFLLYFFSVLSCMLSIDSFATSKELSQEQGPQPMRISLRHIENKGVGYNTGYTTLEAFLAPSGKNWNATPFLDLRGHVFDNGKFASNIGAGFRLLNNCRIYGVNVYYDYRKTKHQHYNQMSLGFETIGIRWDFRVNGYIPVSPKKSKPYDIQSSTTNPSFSSFYGNSALLRQTTTTKSKVEFSMAGADAETGYHILKHKNFDFYAAAGPYYYNYKNRQAIGGKVRLLAKIYQYLSLELINSYDSRFHENIQGSVGFNIPLGPKRKISENTKLKKCKNSYCLNQRLFQDVEKQEIIVVDKFNKTSTSDSIYPAINPQTGLPYTFIFVDNTSSSLGTYESPYPTFAQAQDNSAPGDIIYVFPGDGTTTGMDSGIFLQANQKLWGSGVAHSIQTSTGPTLIPIQTNSSPTITNINPEGDAITLATNNAISGFNITSAMRDAIHGSDPQSLKVSSCTFEDTQTYTINASFSGDASIAITNNQFSNNTNGIFLTLNGTSTVACSDNTFEGQSSVSSTPLELLSINNTLITRIENNVFDNNTTGSIRFNLQDVVNADIIVVNTMMMNNESGSQAALGSSCVVLPTGTIDHCSIVLEGNTFSSNTSNALYLHTDGRFTNLEVTASSNTMSNNGGSGLVLATPVTNLTLLATDNTITQCNDNGIAVIAGESTSTGDITINNNIITDIGNTSHGIAINQDFSTLNLTLLDNEINNCQGTGIVSYAGAGIDSFILNVSGNTISNCQNLGSNAASGLDIEQYTNLLGSVTNNTLSNNVDPAVYIGSTRTSPTVCLTLTGNNSSNYSLTNPVDGTFKLSPCNVDSVNVGTISLNPDAESFTYVQSCPGGAACPP